jgi:hypothetical protein
VLAHVPRAGSAAAPPRVLIPKRGNACARTVAERP